ncbi:RNA-guided endonuclease TnpB family protein [Secundilactobacillus paracollinoides]|uniref:Transposase n=1 Tax=Secundilactobacillus paracollinoides TaxID=240427 RepID=A0A1B2IW25_9LACO|nr:RNA-guided endonuclease TnpB family protein [Secundilactobacillus paracollinoides]ANZ60389.1 transposase [Secundilactobacillus paracollinoides]ANZ66218.1 transposase [Secundilactobacillus paracollinoides]
MVLKGFKLRLYPNEAQQLAINQNFGFNRFIWNQMLGMLIKRYENSPETKLLSAFDLNNLLPTLKQEYPWLKQAESTSLQCTNADLIGAYKKFFKGHAGFPRFKSRKYPKQSYQCKMGIKFTDRTHLKLSKIGVVRFRGGQQALGKVKSVAIRLTATGKYFASVLIDTDITKLPKTGLSVGIDLGVSDLMITSTGVKYPTIRFDKRLAKKKHYWEKRLARRRLQAKQEIACDHHNHVPEPRELADFKNYVKARRMVAQYNEKIANQRYDYLSKLTKALVEQFDVVKMEDLKTKNLLKNHKLARAIANQAWREIRRQLTYKCAFYGKQLVTVSPYKTSQLCSSCGFDDGKHPLEIRSWTCPDCHTQHDRDINAARNILQGS